MPHISGLLLSTLTTGTPLVLLCGYLIPLFAVGLLFALLLPDKKLADISPPGAADLPPQPAAPAD